MNGPAKRAAFQTLPQVKREKREPRQPSAPVDNLSALHKFLQDVLLSIRTLFRVRHISHATCPDAIFLNHIKSRVLMYIEL